MLASITPLGERSRNSKWGITVTAFILGSAAGGAAVGAAAGAAGIPVGSLVSPSMRTWTLAAVIVLGAVLDTRLLGLPLPSVRRQVNEQWLHRYRGWVYGLGFGTQLGTGTATVVTTSAVYSMLAAEVLAGSAVWGTLVGLTFGLARGLTVVPSRRVRRPGDLSAIDALLRRWERPARVASAALLSAVAAIAAVGGLR
jgi:hypothetical protein